MRRRAIVVVADGLRRDMVVVTVGQARQPFGYVSAADVSANQGQARRG
jgi:hypothetical protein